MSLQLLHLLHPPAGPPTPTSLSWFSSRSSPGILSGKVIGNELADSGVGRGPGQASERAHASRTERNQANVAAGRIKVTQESFLIA